ncbi:hypothetical protein [Nannocystis sp.]|uniref:hypothetical protein n=1 Tax=Nannocystis sp. TaxID=1962667 RepID=UPI0025E76077|nr:hypothetical protein [Nannocystis sp.]MBK7823668.1 hypothetical protein [Nannocystis sp.]
MTPLPRSEQRLAQGIEVLDAVRGGRVARPIRVDLEGQWAPRNVTPGSPYTRPSGWRDSPGVSRHASCLHALLYHPALIALKPADRHVAIYIHDHARWFVPRRIRVPLVDPHDIERDDLGLHPIEQRIRHIAVFPGTAYEFSERMTGLRGQVLRDGVPVAWARIEALYPDHGDMVAGHAHGDDRGEFLLLVGAHPAPFVDPQGTIAVSIRVFGPSVPPAPATDVLAALPVEDLPTPGAPDPISAGTTPPAGYQAAPLFPVALRLGRISSAVLPFSP